MSTCFLKLADLSDTLGSYDVTPGTDMLFTLLLGDKQARRHWVES